MLMYSILAGFWCVSSTCAAANARGLASRLVVVRFGGDFCICKRWPAQYWTHRPWEITPHPIIARNYDVNSSRRQRQARGCQARIQNLPDCGIYNEIAGRIAALT